MDCYFFVPGFAALSHFSRLSGGIEGGGPSVIHEATPTPALPSREREGKSPVSSGAVGAMP